MQERLSVVLPTYNERENIEPLLQKLVSIGGEFDLEILIVDDDSTDGTAELVKKLARQDKRIRLIRRLGRSGLSSAIKEGLLDSTADLAAVMDSDGQHEPLDVINAVRHLKDNNLDIVVGSRFLSEAKIRGLSHHRTGSSIWANRLSRLSLPKQYTHLTDYMSGCFVVNLNSCFTNIRRVDVNGFKFFYELLAVSSGKLSISEVPLTFQPRLHGTSKLDLAIVWDFLISFIHTLSFRILPRRAISFGLVGSTGAFLQLTTTYFLMNIFTLVFEKALPISVLLVVTFNYLMNNLLTFRAQRLHNLFLLKGLLKFLLVSSLPVLANVGLATAFYNSVSSSTFWAQLAGIFVAFIWNYAASSRFVWNTP